jgi:hypothetical protein
MVGGSVGEKAHVSALRSTTLFGLAVVIALGLTLTACEPAQLTADYRFQNSLDSTGVSPAPPRLTGIRDNGSNAFVADPALSGEG